MGGKHIHRRVAEDRANRALYDRINLRRRAMYPEGWPRCPSCDDFALDGHITCGRVECDERGARDGRLAEELLQRGVVVRQGPSNES